MSSSLADANLNQGIEKVALFQVVSSTQIRDSGLLLENAVSDWGCKHEVFDRTDITYMSSAGVRPQARPNPRSYHIHRHQAHVVMWILLDCALSSSA